MKARATPVRATPARATSVRATPTRSEPTFDAFAIAAPGISGLLADELRALGLTLGEESAAGVSFRATTSQLFLVNLWSRLASRVIVRLASFTARDFATLEKQAARVSWKGVVSPGSAVRFRVTCRKSRLYHSDAVAERLARGVMNAVRDVTVLERATADDEDDATARDEQLFVVRFEHDVCTISADTSGALLHRRGWRQAIAKAPLRETLAAAMLAACRWSGERALVDPFCGSGTIGIEAALRARNIAPGRARHFAMERWPEVDTAMLTRLRADAAAKEKPAAGVRIVLSDRDAGACDAARTNAERAGVVADLEITQRALSDVDLAAIAHDGLILTNPPYGQRVSGGADLRNLYSRFGDVVREVTHVGGAWDAALLVPDRRLVSPSRLRFVSAFKSSNGGIPVSLELARA